MKTRELAPVDESPEDWEPIERAIIEAIRKELYQPLINLFGSSPPGRPRLTNSTEDLMEAIRVGRISFARGRFTGKFDAKTSREIKRLGGVWNRKGYFVIARADVGIEVLQAQEAADQAFTALREKLFKCLDAVKPEDIADKININDLLSRTMKRTEKKFQESIEGVTIAPELPPARLARIADEYTNTVLLEIKEWTQNETVELRKRMNERVFAGYRHEGMISEIQSSYGVTRSKAKFLARQETSLLVAKYTQARFEDAGVDEYRWKCVAGSADHPVRPFHKKNDGKTFQWKNPPTVNKKGDRKNPKQDYNCRCKAIPVVRF